MISPPPPTSPPQSPSSTQSVPSGRRSNHLGLPTSPTESMAFHRLSSLTERDHVPTIQLPPPHPPLPQPIPKRELSPMRFAAPSPPPLLNSHFDAFSVRSLVSNGVLSRTSTISSGYRRAQRTEALKHLEGRGADGAVGRIKPRLSQNFMFLSDDEEEEEENQPPSVGRNIDVIVEEVNEMKTDMEEAWNRIVRGNVAEFSWYEGTPHASTFKSVTTVEPQIDGDVGANIDEIFGLRPLSSSNTVLPMARSPSDKPRESKRSRRTKSPLPLIQPLPQPALPLPRASQSQFPPRLHTPPSTRSPSLSPASIGPRSLHRPSATHSRNSPAPSRLHPHEERGIRQRTVSDVGSSKSHNQLLTSEARTRALRGGSPKAMPAAPAPRAPSSSRRPRFLDVANEEPSFIDMRDEPPDYDSRTDSWNSLFEVSCTA